MFFLLIHIKNKFLNSSWPKLLENRHIVILMTSSVFPFGCLVLSPHGDFEGRTVSLSCILQPNNENFVAILGVLRLVPLPTSLTDFNSLSSPTLDSPQIITPNTATTPFLIPPVSSVHSKTPSLPTSSSSSLQSSLITTLSSLLTIFHSSNPMAIVIGWG